ncbi:MAG: fructose-specific PTS transporter subunit EIIC [Paenibacillus macerans]|uniref:PTS fructose transporter subunit IIC n=3 Tax=Paenibacillus macerans TaxID=44252 RepID=A0A090ZJ54_PAEMA|nr:fructose-specific PTS transporter subunit EIIC [Paenibacillus macerans]KFN10627.1 PTS system, fructose subfamily, IIA component domain protein [Paenibacillus macerans]MBS5914397.1 fructose-specific PTS transporter subunit EIIC [Paenibacillus macerans]MCY7562312.1 fructose-specific PTS transporter subunit EIIC [Paenibacillus macerans]MDU7475962.1 fructose-specific PTS transporter subunit EIIC [Paenibacillus macerans]MEC0137264.1 fructose-specific PTS transporter subunit EIIC [Paenibacillus m
MRITDLMIKETMIMDLQASSKEAAIDELIASLAASGRINDPAKFKAAILKREEQASTGIGGGIAMPHAKTAAVNEPTVVFAKSGQGVDYDALDGEPAYLFFMIAAPEGAGNTHLRTLAALSRLLIDSGFIAKLKEAKTPDEVAALFDAKQAEEEAAKEAENSAGANGGTGGNKSGPSANRANTNVTGGDAAKKEVPTAFSGGGPADAEPFVVAVTACPTGIAHTFMAEDALKKKAREMGVAIRVETNGSEGAQNVLTADEIRRAQGVIVAADKNVEMARFEGKPVLQRPVSDGIRKPEELIRKAVSGDAPIYRGGGAKSAENGNEERSGRSKIYKDLMSGISHMLPFVVGGGILLAVSFLIEQVAGENSPLFQLLQTIGGGNGAFHFLIPILAGFIAFSIGDRPALMPGMVGGLMAVNANAGFLGGLAAGFLAGYVVILLRKVFAGLPKTLDGLKPILLYPIFGLLISGSIMFYIVDPIFSWINTGLIDVLNHLGTGNMVILGLILGGMMAIDMGGPFNKAAYAFAIGVFTSSGNTNGAMMAAVMAGGMVPPLAIALATTFFKGKFTEQERKSGVTNYVLGLSFITEGAIPFAASDPMRVLTSCILGSAIAGGLTQLWKINVPAPHGGIFVAVLANHALLFLLAVLIGSVVSALVLGVWKKTLAAN